MVFIIRFIVHQTQVEDNLATNNNGGGLYSSGPLAFMILILSNETPHNRGGYFSTGGGNAS